MSERIITLFGEEIIPEQPKTAPRSRSKKKTEEQKETEGEEDKGGDVVTPAQNAIPTAEEAAQPNAEMVAKTLPVVEAIEIPSAIEEPAIVHLGDTTEETAEAAPGETETAEVLVPADILTEVSELSAHSPVTQATEVEVPDEDLASEESETVTEEQTDTASDTTEESPADIKKVKSKKEPKEHINLPADWKGEKHYYTIGEVAELFTVKTSHIRFWTNEFKLKVRTTRKGDRLYTPEQIKEIRAIHHLVKERGFTLNGAKAKLAEPENMEVETVDLKKALTELRSKLIAIKNQLK